MFYPENVVYESCKKFRNILDWGMIREYVKEFTTHMLQIPRIMDEELMFYYADGQQMLEKEELQQRGVQYVDETIVVAESLTDLCDWSFWVL